MALNEVYKDADSLVYEVDEAVESGDFVILGGNIRGVAETDAAEGDDGDWYATLRHVGVFLGTSNDAFTLGAPVYLASGVAFGTIVTNSSNSGANGRVGYAAKAKGAGAGNVFVRINN
jgi:predicted RecA/RadA family phage recombinase